MTPDADSLPTDPTTLRALLLNEHQRRIEAEGMAAREKSGRIEAETESERLRAIIKELQRHRFGARSEKLDPDQLALALEELEQTAAAAEAAEEQAANPAGTKRAPRRRNLGHLPAHLPRIEKVIDIADRTCPCCAGQLHQIGEDVSERLDVVPAQFQVIVTRRPKYGCRACEGAVVQAPALAHAVEGGLPTEALIAQVIVAKYADHSPLYRQSQIYARQGIELDRATLADWVGRAAWFLDPLHRCLRADLLTSAKLFADETPAPVLDPGRGRTKTGQLWAYARDDRPWQGNQPPAVAYVYAPDRKGERPREHLAGFKGILQVDGYGGYRSIGESGEVCLAFCWAHARRRFYEIADGGQAPIAEEALRRIAELYGIEGEIRGQDAQTRQAVRQERSRPLTEALKPWLAAQLDAVSGKSKTAEAIRYVLSHWTGLIRFLDDGRIEMDTNPVERAIRPLALTRKNALFAGSDGGAQHWACLASLIGTCKLNHIDPQAYLADVLARIVAGHPINRIDELLPWRWKTHHPASTVAA
jgi:transposase